MTQGYLCRSCGRTHDGLPFSYGSDAPAYWSSGFAADDRSILDQELCVIRAEHYFVRARLVIEVTDAEDDFDWGVWVSLSRENFRRVYEMWESPDRAAEPPYFGWLSTELPAYPVSTLNLRTNLHTMPPGERPLVELEPTGHPLAVEQRTGITVARVQEIAELLLHAAR